MKKLILFAFLLLSIGVMAQKQHINQTAPKDNLKQAFEKTNENFDELYVSRDSVADAMADTLQLLTILTQSQLITLIDGNDLNAGLQYFVSNRGWHLIAVNDSVLKPLTGSMTLTNGDTLITGVEPDVLWIELPTAEYGTATEIVFPAGYYPVQMIVKNLEAEGDPSRPILYSESIDTIIIGYFDNYAVASGTTVLYLPYETNYPVAKFRDTYLFSDALGNSLNVFIKFERSQF